MAGQKNISTSLVDRTLNNWFKLNHGSFWSRYHSVLRVYTNITIIILSCVFFVWLSAKNFSMLNIGTGNISIHSQLLIDICAYVQMFIVAVGIIYFGFLFPLLRLVLTKKRYQVFHEQWCTAYDNGFHMSFDDVSITFKSHDLMESSSNWTYIGFWQKVDGGIILARNMKPTYNISSYHILAIITEDHEDFQSFEKMCYKKLGDPDHKQINHCDFENMEYCDKKPEMRELEPEEGNASNALAHYGQRKIIMGICLSYIVFLGLMVIPKAVFLPANVIIKLLLFYCGLIVLFYCLHVLIGFIPLQRKTKMNALNLSLYYTHFGYDEKGCCSSIKMVDKKGCVEAHAKRMYLSWHRVNKVIPLCKGWSIARTVQGGYVIPLQDAVIKSILCRIKDVSQNG